MATIDIEKILNKDKRSVARAITHIESGYDGAVELLEELHKFTGKSIQSWCYRTSRCRQKYFNFAAD